MTGRAPHRPPPLKDPLGLILLLLAFALRWPHPSPEWSHVDERAFVLYPLGFWSGDLNPHFFNYPTFTLYAASALYYLYYLLCSAETFEYFVAYRYFVDPHDLLFIARSANSLLSTATVAICIAIGGRLYGRVGGLLAGLLLAIMPLHVRFAHLAITDVAAGFFATLAVLYAVRVAQDPQRRSLALAGVWAGLAAASKYPAGLALVPVLAAGLMHRPYRPLWRPVATAALVFAATSPYILLDWSAFWHDFSGMFHTHALGAEARADGDPAWLHWLGHNLRYGLGWAGLLAVAAALVWRGRGWRREELVVLVGAAAFAALLFGTSSTFMRYAQPLAPLLAVLMARSALALARWRVVFAAWLLLLLAEPLYASLQQRALLAGADTRVLARDWLQAHPTAGRRIIQIPKSSGLVPLLKPEQIFSYMGSFVTSYGRAALEPAIGALARGPALPGLFIDRTPAGFDGSQLPQPSARPSAGSLLVITYRHPLSGMDSADSLARATLDALAPWQQAFAAGQAAGAVYDPVDFYFVPIGGFALQARSGPDIRIGVLPWHDAQPVPTGREFFSAFHLLLVGDKAMRAQRWPEAAAAFRSLLEQPFLYDELFTLSYLHAMYLGIGQTMLHLDGDDETRALFKATEPFLHLGALAAATGQHELSIQYYLQASRLDPDNAILFHRLGAGFLRLQRYAESIETLERAVALSPSVAALLDLAMAYEYDGRVERAQAAYARARQLGGNR